MATPDRIPQPSPNADFPVGDLDGELERKMLGQIQSLQYGNVAEVHQKLSLFRFNQAERWRTDKKQDENNAGMNSLAVNWGYTMMGYESGFGSRHFVLGFENTVAFADRHSLFPTKFHDFTEQMREMRGYDSHQIKSFTNDTRHAMLVSHPKLYGVISPLSILVAGTFGLQSDPRAQLLLDAGVGLAYTMGAITQMEEGLKDELDDNNKTAEHIAAFIREINEEDQ